MLLLTWRNDGARSLALCGSQHLSPSDACISAPLSILSLLQHPEIELTLALDDRRVEAAAEGYDAVLRHGPINDSRLTAWPLAASRRVLVASPSYLGRCGVPASLDDLDAHQGIFYTNRGVADWRFIGSSGALIRRGRPGLRVNNGDMMRDAVIAGLGISLLPMFIVGMSIRQGELCVIDVGVEAEQEFIYVAHPEGRRPSEKRASPRPIPEAGIRRSAILGVTARREGLPISHAGLRRDAAGQGRLAGALFRAERVVAVSSRPGGPRPFHPRNLARHNGPAAGMMASRPQAGQAQAGMA